MAPNHSGNSKGCSSTAYTTTLTRNNNITPKKGREPPILKAAHYLAEGFKELASTNDDES